MWSEQMEIMPGRAETPALDSLGTSLGEWAKGILGT